MDAIDLHAHFLTSEYVAALARHGALERDGFPLPSWDADEHLRFMDEAGIATAMLSLSSPHPWFGDASEATELARSLNEGAAEVKAAHPGRFLFAASLPLPDVGRSLEEIGYACDVLGADAVKLPSNAAGVYPGNPRLEPVLDELDRREAVVLLHPCAPAAGMPECFSGRVLPVMEFLADTTRCVMELLVSGSLTRHPHLRIVVPHCGSFLPTIARRIAGVSHVLAATGRLDASVDVGAFRGLWYDLAGDVTPESLEALRAVAADDHIVYGSDYPFTPTASALEHQASLEDLLGANLWQSASRDNPAALLGSA